MTRTVLFDSRRSFEKYVFVVVERRELLVAVGVGGERGEKGACTTGRTKGSSKILLPPLYPIY